MTAALESSGQQHAPAALYLRERPGTHFTVGWVGPSACLNGRKFIAPTGIRYRTVQPVVSGYTDWATGPTSYVITAIKWKEEVHTLRRLYVLEDQHWWIPHNINSRAQFLVFHDSLCFPSRNFSATCNASILIFFKFYAQNEFLLIS